MSSGFISLTFPRAIVRLTTLQLSWLLAPHQSTSGVFGELATRAFLTYNRFGSIVIEDPAALTNTIFQATKNAGVRALVSAGWAGLGSRSAPDHVFILGNVPHDWLFDKVRAVVHHGGAGTTAIGLRMGKPTVIVPFFGDQPFWGTFITSST